MQTDRVQFPKSFIALPRNQWNDVLNNYRIPLGEYDYKRMLFANKFLYTKEEFDSMYKFTIVRNPYDRIVSAWKYLLRQRTYHPKKIWMRHDFRRFLKELPILWEEKYDRHIATHTAPVWGDITDENGELLVDFIAKLENIQADMKIICDKQNWTYNSFKHINQNREIHAYRKYYNKTSRKLVEELYGQDIERLQYAF